MKPDFPEPSGTPANLLRQPPTPAPAPNKASEETRNAPAAGSTRESNLLAEIDALQQLVAAQATVARAQLDRLADLEQRLEAALAESASRLARIQELDAEQRAMKASRCWRWTAWLRSIERTLGRRGQG